MGGRTEPRFRTDAGSVVEVLRDKAYTLPARIFNFSGTGFQIETMEPLKVGETIRLAVEGYQILGEVRHCMPHGSTYRIGAERVDKWDGNVIADPQAVPGHPVLGRPILKNPVGSLRSVALRELFADPRLRAQRVKYQAVALVAAAVALAAWAGISALLQVTGHK
jgi:PilZ domain-containing protein